MSQAGLISGGGGGSGNVVGPGSSTANTVPIFADTTGKLLADTAVLIDSTNNVIANNALSSQALVTSAGGTTVLTKASARVQQLTGAAAQTFQLPNATTLTIGWTFEFNNNSSGALTVANNGGTTLFNIPPGGYARVTASSIGTANGTWDRHFLMPANASYGTSGLTVTGSITSTISTASSTLICTVANGSNTANSNAVYTAQVAGATAADAYYTAQITAGQVWSWGLDNSDSDAWALASSASLGTTNVMRVATTGEINFPLQSAFLAYLGAVDSNVTGDGTAYNVGTTVAFTKVFDQNTDFNTNGTYTAPVTSKVQFNCGLLAEQVTTAMTASLAITTSNRVYTFGNYAGLPAPGNFPLNISVLADMDAADTAVMTVDFGGGAKVVDIFGDPTDVRTFFSGYIAC